MHLSAGSPRGLEAARAVHVSNGQSAIPESRSPVQRLQVQVQVQVSKRVRGCVKPICRQCISPSQGVRVSAGHRLTCVWARVSVRVRDLASMRLAVRLLGRT